MTSYSKISNIGPLCLPISFLFFGSIQKVAVKIYRELLSYNVTAGGVPDITTVFAFFVFVLALFLFFFTFYSKCFCFKFAFFYCGFCFPDLKFFFYWIEFYSVICIVLLDRLCFLLHVYDFDVSELSFCVDASVFFAYIHRW